MLPHDDIFTRPATDEERANFVPLTDAELEEALAEGARHRALLEASYGSVVIPNIYFR